MTLAFAIAAAAVCTRLGLWQVSRLQERRAYNALLMTRLSEPPSQFKDLSPDTALGHYRRVTATGVLVYDREVVWAPRMRRSSPGVNFLTPMRLGASDTVVLVNRGWAYSPDARTIEFSRWRESDSAAVAGYVETWSQACGDMSEPGLPATCGDTAARALRRLDRSAAERLVGGPVAPYILMQTSDSMLRADSVPARVDTPVLDEGPHFNYAAQWFAFAAVALAVGGVLARKEQSR